MRKAIIAAIVATALFAVGAFAAEFVVDAEDIASGQDSVVACADRIEARFDAAYWDDAEARHEVDGMTLSFFDGSDLTTTDDCDGLEATVVIQLADPANDYEIDVTVGDGTLGDSGVIDLSQNLVVSQVTGVAVLIEDYELNDDTGNFEAF